jgi:Stress responsive A/B Barrel Domain
MVRHIVLWRLKAPAEADLASGRIPGLLRVEVGRSFNTGKRATDFALICDFANRETRAAVVAHQTPTSMRTAKP